MNYGVFSYQSARTISGRNENVSILCFVNLCGIVANEHVVST